MLTLATRETSPSHQPDVDAIQRIGSIPLILELVCAVTRMGFAVVARVTEDRWVACGVRDGIPIGLRPGDELSVQTTICDSVRRHRRHFSVNELQGEERPSPSTQGFDSWISAPIITADGSFFGTLCAIDRKPGMLGRPGDSGPTRSFKLLAELVGRHLDADAERARAEATACLARETSRRRDLSIAAINHDLRNPLAAIGACMRLLRRCGDQADEIIRNVELNILRMSGLISDLLDFAEGTHGGGLTIHEDVAYALEETLIQVVQELRLVHPSRTVATVFALGEVVRCDPARIAQLLSNLLGNALTHGSPDGIVRVAGFTWDGEFELSVSNGGEPIPTAVLATLHLPFFKGPERPGHRGLGLGLFIASEIARAHHGRIDVASTTEETRFTFRMPLGLSATHDASDR